jgi:hypothetical protein
MFRKIVLALLLGAAIAMPAQASSVRELLLEEIIDDAAVVFQGTVTENRAARDTETGRIVTFTTFLVQETLKGQVAQTHTIKQLGGELPAEGVGYKVDARTTFAVGSTYVVFLYGTSPLGFSSPVGTVQGKFAVVQDEAGLAVTNGRDFNELSRNMAADKATAKARANARADSKKVGLDDFKQLVRARVGGAK